MTYSTPFTRINLPANNCDRFSLMFHIQADIPKKEIAEYISDYGYSYRRSKQPHRITGLLGSTPKTGLHHIEVSYRVVEKLNPPPASFKNPDVLWGLIEHVGMISSLYITAQFRYSPERWISLVEIPAPLDDPESFPFTHIDGYVFSKRTDDGVQHRISVAMSRSNELRHVVGFQRDQIAFSSSFITQLFNECCGLSLLWVERGDFVDG